MRILFLHTDPEIKLLMDFNTFKVFSFFFLFLRYLYLNFMLTVAMKKEEDEVEKLMELSVLIGVRTVKVFHFLRKYVRVKRIMYSNVTFIVK